MLESINDGRSMASAAGQERPWTLRATLERQRRVTRERQLVCVLALLRRRVRAVEAIGAERRGLDRAISEFGRELDQLRRQDRAA